MRTLVLDIFMAQSKGEGSINGADDSHELEGQDFTCYVQGGFDFDLPIVPVVGSADWYNDNDLREVGQELQVLRHSDEPLTKVELAQRIYPKAFTTGDKYLMDEYGKRYNFSRIVERNYIDRVAQRIRALDHSINEKLDELTGEPLAQLNYLRQVSVAIRVGEDEQGRVLFAYHGPDAPQPPEVLEEYMTWAESHQAKNSRLQKLAGQLYKSSVNSSGLQLDNLDIPGVDDVPAQGELGFGS